MIMFCLNIIFFTQSLSDIETIILTGTIHNATFSRVIKLNKLCDFFNLLVFRSLNHFIKQIWSIKTTKKEIGKFHLELVNYIHFDFLSSSSS